MPAVDVLRIGKYQPNYKHKISIAPARLAQSVERKALNFVVVAKAMQLPESRVVWHFDEHMGAR